MPIYWPGQVVTLRTSEPFSVDGTPTDPETVTLTVQAPDGSQTTYVYGVDPEMERESTGVYARDVQVDQGGLWVWSWTGTGAAAGVDMGSFTVSKTLLDGLALTSVPAVKGQMETASSATDDLIQSLIIEASRAVMAHIRRRIRPLDSSDVERVFPVGVWEARERKVMIDDLSQAPSEVQIVDRGREPLADLTVSDEIDLLPLNRQPYEPITGIWLRPSAPTPASGQLLRVVGRWGWPEVPEDVERACIITVRSWLRTEAASSAEYGYDEGGRVVAPAPQGGWMLPMAAKQLLGPYRRLVVA